MSAYLKFDKDFRMKRQTQHKHVYNCVCKLINISVVCIYYPLRATWYIAFSKELYWYHPL